jgi:pimeloyl-ACP methyl ester carboxylesterase
MAKMMANQVRSATYKVPDPSGVVDLVVEERGEGQPFLLLHGGAGPVSMSRFASMLADRRPARVLTPTHPGFARTPRPEGLNTVKSLARLYAQLLKQLDLANVTVIGNSVGSWIAAELGLLGTPRIRHLVLTGAVGIEFPGHPIPDTSKMTLDQIMSLSYHDPKPFRIDPTRMTDEQRAVAASNRAALGIYAPKNTDPSLAARLSKMTVPTLVISGDSDRIVTPEYGHLRPQSREQNSNY